MVTLMTAAPSAPPHPPRGDSEAGGATAMQPGAVGLVAAATTERSGFSLFFEYIRVAFLAEAADEAESGVPKKRNQ
jgi:hypothetical protein